ncbi:MAG: hypothetical protein MUC49_02665 [Raineya sp.]|jgi:hypothetical protein|nr:hypothetical protein [Raineya sp.]
MKKLFLTWMLSFFFLHIYAQEEGTANSVEGKITLLTGMQSMTAKLYVPYTKGSLKGKAIKIIKKFNLSDTFGPSISGQGTMGLGTGVIISHQGNIVVVKIKEYSSTKVENGVTKPLANIGNVVVFEWE